MATLKLTIPAPIYAVELTTGQARSSAGQQAAVVQVQHQMQQLKHLMAALHQAIEQMEQLRQQWFISHRQHIARLCVQIAEKILCQRIAAGDYDIQTIIANALQAVPPAQKIVIRLNPNDLKTLQSQQAQNELILPPQTEFLPDWSIRQAECVIETDIGNVEYLIQHHLKQIEQVLSSLETSAQ